MGMKANSGYFKGTRGELKFKLNIQNFASKIFNKSGHVSLKSLNEHGSDLLDKNSKEIKEMMVEAGYEVEIKPSIHKTSSAQRVISLNSSKDRNISQIQVSLNGSSRHGNVPYVKVSTKDIGIVKIVNGSKDEYKAGKDEKAKIYFKGGRKK